MRLLPCYASRVAFALALATGATVVTAPASPVAQPSAELTADQIVNRALDTDSVGFSSGQVTMTLQIVDGGGDTRERRLQIRGRDNEGRNQAVVRVVAPAAQAGQAWLFLQNPAGEDDIHVYLPALDDAPRRIAGSQKNASFLGSHFTFADLESRDIRDATYVRQPDETIGPHAVYVIDATPNRAANSAYARVRMWVRTSDFLPLRTRFFDASGATVKTLFTEETDLHNGRPYVRQMTLRVETGGSTTIRLEDVDFDAVISAAELTPAALVQ